MKCLEIKDGKGFFLRETGDMVLLDQMKKEDLLYLLNIATSNEQVFEMDDIEQNIIENTAHRIIYTHLSEKFSDLLANKKGFLDECENSYKEALQKYQTSSK
jgi:hypothetical protein